jgi:hypothetical protein
VRIKKIMPRRMDENKTSHLVQEIRKELRIASGHDTTDDLGKIDAYDESCCLAYGCICGGVAWCFPSQICVSLGEVSVLFRSYFVVPPSGFFGCSGFDVCSDLAPFGGVDVFFYLVGVMPEL